MQIRSLLSYAAERLGLISLARSLLVRDGRFALMFHRVSSRRYADIPDELQPHHSVEEFRQVLSWIEKRFSFLTVEDYLFDRKPGVLLTFDDGHADNFTNVLPVLAEFNAPGLFFVATQHVQAPRNWLHFTRKHALQSWGKESAVPEEFARDCYDGLSEEQLKELARSPLVTIGSHTISHPSLPTCSPEELDKELIESRQYLEKVIGQDVDYFAYPFGNYNRQVAEAAKNVGYRAAFAVNSNNVGLSDYEIPRIGIYQAGSPYLNTKMSGLHRPPLKGPALKTKV